MKKLILSLVLLVISLVAVAQTWTGATDTDWTKPANWTGGVPTATGNVIIPGALTNYPKLAANTTINVIDMQAGSQLDVNGFELTITSAISNYNYFIGATINNTNLATDIVINLNTGVAGYISYIRSSTFTDHVTFNVTGSNQLNEGDAAVPNTYMGNAIYNMNSTINFYFSYSSKSAVTGNLTINRPAGGFTNAFANGADITGNYTFTNPIGGQAIFGALTNKTAIGGIVNISLTETAATNNLFQMYRLVNQTSGGNINVQNRGRWDIQADTIKVTSLTLNGLQSEYFYMFNNKIQGNVSTADNAANGGGYQSYVRNNEITGTSTFTNNSNSNQFNEAEIGNSSNHFIGNTTFNANGAGTFVISHGSKSVFDGNVTVNKSGTAGVIYVGNAGATISGNFLYSNPIGGTTYLGNLASKTAIGGTLNVSLTDPANNVFQMHRLVNQVNGGNITINSLGEWNVQGDTIKVAALTMAGLHSRYFYLFNNKILGNVTTSDNPASGGGYQSYIRNNEITGTSTFTNNSNSNPFNDAELPNSSNHFIGNTTFNANGSAQVLISHGSKSIYDGNLSVNKINTGAAGNIYVGYAGANIAGNFSITNPLGGITSLGNLGVGLKTSIGGTLNVNLTDPNNNLFQMHHLVNQTNGGNIAINSLGEWNVQADTIKVTALNMTGLQSRYFYMYNNKILGDVTTTDNLNNADGYQSYIRNNEITGTTIFTNNSNQNQFNEAEIPSSANIFNGNVTFNAHGTGTFVMSHGSKSTFNGNVTINKTRTAGTIYMGNAGANITGNLSYSNMLGGNLYLGNLAAKTSIGGTLNINHTDLNYSHFQMHRLVNQASGGSININSLGEWNVQGDTIKVVNMALSGLNSRYFYLYDNKITGNVSTADNAANSSGYYSQIYRNEIIGNTVFTNNGTNIFFDANTGSSGNKYVGNVTYNKVGPGAIQIASGSTNTIHGNMTLNSAAGISLGLFEFAGATNSILEQVGAQAIDLASITMNKTGAQTLTLADPITLAQNLTLTNGIINNNATNVLNMLAGSATTGAKNSSHVNGYVSKDGNTAFTFPVGQSGFYAPIGITAPSVSSTFLAKYNRANTPSTSPLAFGLDHLLSSEYWDLTRTTGTGTAKVTLNYDEARTYYCINSLPDLRVANFNTAIWNNEGIDAGGTIPAANVNAFDIQSANIISTFGQFAMGSSTILNPFVDIIKPTITAPSNISQAISTGCTVTVASLGTPTTADNCRVATVVNNHPSTTYPLGVTNVTWTVTDLTGNTQTAIQTVNISDPILPTITAPATVNVFTNTACTATGVTLGTPTTADNCTVASVTNNAPPAFPLGNTIVTWTVTDGTGNTRTATQTVTVTDNVKPTITVIPVNATTNSACTATGVVLGTPVTGDNCSVATVVNNHASTTYPLGVTNVTWTVTDGSGNTQTVTQVVTIMDNVLPSITAPATVNTTTNTACTATGVTLGTPITNDNCIVASTTNNAPSAFPLGNTLVTWTVTDGSGNTKTATQTVTVTDNVKPTITAPANVTGVTNAVCSLTGVVLGTPTTNDNCGVMSITNNYAGGTTFPQGVTNVIWTVTDNAGNTQTAMQTVTITSSITPTITAGGPLQFCPGENVILNASAATSYLWSNGATTQSITVSIAGTFTVVTTTGGCNSLVSLGKTTIVANTQFTVSWTGTTNTDWNTPTNWSSGFVPNKCTNVTIPNTTNKPLVTGTANVANKITVNAGAIINMAAGAKLDVKGN